MELLNKNIEAALERLNTTEENKKILRSILYREHLNRERDWDTEAPNEIRKIMQEASGEK